jgi:hypothetical protein
MTHLMGYFLVFGLLALSHTAVAGPGRGKPAEFIIRAEGDMLTLKATDVSQQRLLEGLAKAHSPGFSGGVCHRSAKASRGEDLEIEEPISCWDCSSFDFHATLASVLGTTLVGHQVV